MTVETRPSQCARCNDGKRVQSKSKMITPVEFVELKLIKRVGKDIVIWYGEEPVDTILFGAHSCSLHFYACSGDSSLVKRDVGKYELCLRVEKIDYAVWRQRLHDEVDALKGDELYSELIGGW
ncbi:hypothetical protein LCGC14_1683320 [marine sediment metagenome]|uniref:Uncharacterized protein n=1 Tax=marine sediment metagenome TaxID=412755 RepID=A0A0F9HNF9_9ZZZZ